MSHQQKKRILQKLFGWIFLSANCLVATLFLGDKNEHFLVRGLFLSALIICYGALKTYRDKRKSDFSGMSVAIQYICVYVITFVATFKLADYLSSIVLLTTMCVVSLTELLAFVVFTNWGDIKRIFRKS